MVRHLVRKAGDGPEFRPSAAQWLRGIDGYLRWTVVDEQTPDAVHTGFGICSLQPGASLPAHVHSFEESFFLLEGEVVLDDADGSHLLRPGDYGILPIGSPHLWRNLENLPARWAEMVTPQPRARFGDDTELVAPLTEHEARPIDVRDPRNRNFGHIDPAHMDPGKQGQSHLAVTPSMRTALLLYGGVYVKPMVDSDLGSQLLTMFMVAYEPDGAAGPHDHPFEETYLILEGAANAEFDETAYRLEVGDVAWAGAGCVHSFRNAGSSPVRWLETQAPQPPRRHSYRFARDWDYLRAILREK